MFKILIRRLFFAAVRTLINNTPLAPLAWIGPDLIRQAKSQLLWLLRPGKTA